MGAPSQLGTAVKIGFGAFAYTGYWAEDGLEWNKGTADIDELRDEDNNTFCKIISNPGRSLRGSFTILGSGSVTPPLKAATITFTDPAGTATQKYRVESASVVFSRLASVLNLDLVKKDSMTYT